MVNFFKLLLISIVYYHDVSASSEDSSISNSTRGFIINEMVKILLNCYANVESIIFHADADQLAIQSIQKTNHFSVFLIDDSSKRNTKMKPPTRMNLFVITTDSEAHLQSILLKFKSTSWWDIQTSFFILDKSNGRCENAMSILRTAWKMNLPKSLFLCIDSDEVPMIFTYNPYTNRAPKPWKSVPSVTKQSDGWTMYARPNRGENVCQNLDFDRTRYLDGSVIRVVINLPEMHSWIPGKDYDESIIKIMHPHDMVMAKTLKRVLNVTFVFNVDDPAFNISTEPYGFFKRIQNGSSDLALCLRSPLSVYGLTTSYPVLYSNHFITTNNRGFYTPLEKIKNYYGIVTLVSMCVILAMTFTVIVLSGKKRRWAFAGFEILRLLINTSVLSRMNTLSLKIFFAMIFLYTLIMQSTFQGHLASFLTQDQYRSNVEKLEDLKDSRYNEIYGSRSVVPIITDPLLKQKLIVGHPDCSTAIIGKDSAACIADIGYLLKPTFDHKLHLSKQSINKVKYVYLTRDDWPLKERFDLFLMQLEQTGITRRWYEFVYEEEIARQKRVTAQTEVHARVISLSMLDFIFVVFAIGITLATISFMFEIRIINILRKMIRKRRAVRRVRVAPR